MKSIETNNYTDAIHRTLAFMIVNKRWYKLATETNRDQISIRMNIKKPIDTNSITKKWNGNANRSKYKSQNRVVMKYATRN